MGNSQSRPQRMSRPLSQTALAASSAASSASSVSLAARVEPADASSSSGHLHLVPAPASKQQQQPCQCQWCIDYAVPDPFHTPSTPLEEFLEFRRQFLSRMGAKNSSSAVAASASAPPTDEDLRSPASTKMDGFKRRFSRSKTSFQRRLSLVSNGDNANNAASSSLQPSDPGSPPAVVGLGLVGDAPLPLSSPQNPPSSGQPRLVSARRRSFNIPGVPARFPLFNRSRHVSHRSDSFFHYKSNTEPLRRSWTDAGAATTATSHHRPRTSSPARAISPCEQGYTHLGTFKFGSLHVVNGCASPAPSSKRQRSCPDLKSLAQSSERLPGVEPEPEPEPEPEVEFEAELESDLDVSMARPEDQFITATPASPASHPPPIPKRSSSRLNGHLFEDAVESQHKQQPRMESPSGSRPKLTPLVTARRPSVSWFDDCPTSPLCYSSPDSALLRPLTPPSIQHSPVLVTQSKENEHDDNLFEDEGMEIPVYWDDTVQSHESFHDPQFHPSLSKERQQEAKKQASSNKRSGTLNKTDSGYSSASAKSTSRYRHTSSRRRSSRDRNCRMFDGDTSQGLIHCDGSINDPVEGTISVTSHGDKEIINAVFPWPPAHLRYPVERYYPSQAIPPKQPQETRYEPNADAMSEYNLDPTYPVRPKYEPSRPPPIPPRHRQPKRVSHAKLSDSQHTQCKIPVPKGLAIDLAPKCTSPRELSPKGHTTKSHAKGHSSKGHPSREPATKSHTAQGHTAKGHTAKGHTAKSHATHSHVAKRPSKRHRDSTPARMTGEKPYSASQLHSRSASDATSSRPSNNINKDKPLPALPQPRDFRFPTAQMLTPPLSRSTSMGDLKLLTNTSPSDLINYIDNHTPVDIDSNMWGSLSADPDIDLELLPLNLDLNKSAFHDYQPRQSLQESINQQARQPNKLHRSASHFSFGSSINQKSSGRHPSFPPSPVRDVFTDRKSRKTKHHSGPPPSSYRISHSKSVATEKRSSRPVKGSSSSCAAQMTSTHQKPGALNHIESYI